MTAVAEPASPARPPATPRPATVADLIDARSPGFDALRLVLAFLVLVSHTWPLGGFGAEPGSPIAPDRLTLGGFAVAGFFAMSGLLVGRSATRRPLGAFTRARALRILPGYLVAVLVSAIPVAALAWVHEHGSLGGFVSTSPNGSLGYVGRALLFPVEMSHGVREVFVTSTPYGRLTGQSFVNGSLWTLPYEVRCYLVIGLVGLAVHRWGERRSIGLAWALTGAAAVAYHQAADLTGFVVGAVADRTLVMLLFVFLTGSLVGTFADRVRLVGWMPLAALAVALVAGHTSLFLSEHVGSASLALVLPTVAMAIAPLGARLRGVDLSYGMYLYAWPVQMLLAMYGLDSGPWAFIVVATLVTTVLAAGSWFGVERPAVRHWSRGRR
ncbi:MAG: acyltransferase [Acidimicrobiales bacterium]